MYQFNKWLSLYTTTSHSLKEINKQHRVPQIKEIHPNEADCSVNTFRIPMFHALKTSNIHFSFSYSTVPCNAHRREIEQHDHAFNMKEFHPSELGHPANPPRFCHYIYLI
jgi:hypothetical protein